MGTNGMTMHGGQLLDEYMKYMEARQYSQHTLDNYGKYVDNFLTACYNEPKDPLKLTTLELQEYVDRFKDKPATATLIANSLRSFYNYYSTIAGKIKTNPGNGLRGVRVPTEEKSCLTMEELKMVFDAVGGIHADRNKLIIALMSLECLRISEVINIELDDIDLNKGTIYIHGKGKKNRIAYLTDELKNYLVDYLYIRRRKFPNSTALFPSQDGRGKISHNTIVAFLNKIGRKTGLHLNPHKFRHTGGTMAYLATKDIVAVQNLLGHENIETTRRYTHVPEENRRNLVENSPINSLLGGV